MRKYYLFAIKSEYSELYSKNPYILYKITIIVYITYRQNANVL